MNEDEVDRPEAGLPRVAQVLLDAVVAIGSDLDLHSVLDRIVASACELTGARYGALGVVGANRELSDFITHGVDPETHRRIGELPRGRGILGLLIDRPVPLRLERLQDHAASFGFPPHHPPMTGFLGVPVLIRGTVFGNLYLTEKRSGGRFTEDDEVLVQALASAAGFVIENARAYAVSERRRAWLEASAALHDTLQPPLDLDDALRHVAAATRAVSGARAVGVLVAGPDGRPELRAADGRDAGELGSLVADLGDRWDAAVAAGGVADELRVRGRRVLVLPLRARLFVGAVLLVVLDDHGRLPGLAAEEDDLVASFADQVALTLDRLQALADREELAIVSDRERIARDLHDVVIQRLFATGLQLQAARGRLAPGRVVEPGVADRLAAAVTDLDDTIRDIRRTIFELHQPRTDSFRADLTALATEYAGALGCTPVVRTTGPVDTLVSPRVAEAALSVLREALSNAARHARAGRVTVEVAAVGTDLLLRVTDDGVGLPEDRLESGLRNLRDRARDLGGAARSERVEPRGTRVEWRVPTG